MAAKEHAELYVSFMEFLMNRDHICKDFRDEVIDCARTDKLCGGLLSQGLFPFKNSLLSVGIIIHR